MAQVPTYDNPQVERRPLPGVRQQSVGTPEFLGSAADTQVQMGAGLTRAGTGISAVALHMQERDNLRRTQEAAAEHTKRVQDYRIEIQQKRVGAAARGLVGEFGKWHQEQVEEIASKLDNDAQRDAFRQIARTRGLATRHDVATFETSETRKANIAAFEADVTNNINAGATALTPEALNTYRTQVINGTRAFAASQNLPAEVEQALLSKNLTEFHAQRIQQLVRNAPDQARAYFEQNRHEIAGARQAEIGEFAQRATAEIRGVGAAGEIWATVGPAKGLDVMEEEARKRFKTEPHTLKATISSLRERQQAYDKGQKDRVDNAAAAVNVAILKGATVTQIRRMPEFIALSSMGAQGVRMANSIVEHVENREYTRTVRESATESRKQQELKRQGMAAYLIYSNPDVLARMSEMEVLNLLPVLGDELTTSLMGKKRSFVKTAAKVIEARIDTEDFNHIAHKAGFRPFDESRSEDEKAQLGELKFHVEQKIDAVQREKGRALTRQEKMLIMADIVDNKVLVERSPFPLSLYGTLTGWYPTLPLDSSRWLFSDRAKPVSMLADEDEMRRAYVVVNGREVMLSSIPAADRAAIIASRRKHGLPVSERAIAEAYVKAKGYPNDFRLKDVARAVPMLYMGGMPTVAAHEALTEWAREPDNRRHPAAIAIRAFLTAEGLTDEEKEENARWLLGDGWIEMQNYLKKNANRFSLGLDNKKE